MKKTISAAEANRHFSKVLRGVREGRSYVVTTHGRPVAKIVPIDQHDGVTASARQALFKRLRAQRVAKVGRWTREELYEEER